MKKIILAAAMVTWSMTAAAIPAETLNKALNSEELKSRLHGVQIKKIQEVAAPKCLQCFQISVQGEKLGILGFPVDYEVIFSTEHNLFENQLMVTIDSETKN